MIVNKVKGLWHINNIIVTVNTLNENDKVTFSVFDPEDVESFWLGKECGEFIYLLKQ